MAGVAPTLGSPHQIAGKPATRGQVDARQILMVGTVEVNEKVPALGARSNRRDSLHSCRSAKAGGREIANNQTSGQRKVPVPVNTGRMALTALKENKTGADTG